MIVENFWTRVKFQVKVHKITLKKFAEYINIPYGTFKSWIYCKRSPEIGTAYNIATALGVSLEYLITGTEGQSAEERAKQVELWKSAEAEMKKLVGKMQEELTKL